MADRSRPAPHGSTGPSHRCRGEELLCLLDKLILTRGLCEAPEERAELQSVVREFTQQVGAEDAELERLLDEASFVLREIHRNVPDEDLPRLRWLWSEQRRREDERAPSDPTRLSHERTADVVDLMISELRELLDRYDVQGGATDDWYRLRDEATATLRSLRMRPHTARPSGSLH
ncbi:MAG: hypothetical protein ACQEXJ_13255 [Myxococcota bacterium]